LDFHLADGEWEIGREELLYRHVRAPIDDPLSLLICPSLLTFNCCLEITKTALDQNPAGKMDQNPVPEMENDPLVHPPGTPSLREQSSMFRLKLSETFA
jgi:hypothetical protein